MKTRGLAVFFVSALLLMSCSCGSGGAASSPSSTPGGPQGVYTGAASNQTAFDTIILPNDKVFAIYGTASGNGISVPEGVVTGQGAPNGNGTYTANVTDIFLGGAATSTFTASYVPGSSVSGTSTEKGSPISFSGTVASDFNTPAVLSAITGNWSGTFLDGNSGSVTINANGSFAGTDSAGCSFSGTVTPDSSNKNFFDVSVSTGGSPCSTPNLSASGIAVDYLSSDSVTQELLIGAASGNNGIIFLASRQSGFSVGGGGSSGGA